jgi:hypothetical protein
MSTVQAPAPPARSSIPYVALGIAILASILAVVALAWVVARDDSEPTSVVQGSGVAAVDTREVAPFSGVELQGVNDVTIGVGSEQLVVVRADDNLVDRITTDVRGGVLVIDETGGLASVTPMRVEITVPSLDEARLSGSGAIVVDGHDLDSLAVVLPGTGTIRAVGTVSNLDVDLAGTGEADLGQLVARDATVTLSGAGSVFVNVTGTLEASVSGAGNVTYTGDPDRVDREISGVGSVTEE